MSQTQKIIKYLAVAFAIFLVFSIISGIMGVMTSLGNIFSPSENTTLETYDINSNISIIDVNVKSSKVVIKKGTSLKAESSSKTINVKQDNNKLFISQKSFNWFSNDNSEVIIYIPSITFDVVSIETGAGKVTIDDLKTKSLNLNLGAGKVNINNLTVTEKTKIDGGAGKINIETGNLSNLDLDMGAGSVTINSSLIGNSKIDAGVGEINLNLIGNDYRIKLDKGIGSASFNGQDIKDDTYYGSGNNLIDIDGGIGSIKIKSR